MLDYIFCQVFSVKFYVMVAFCTFGSLMLNSAYGVRENKKKPAIWQVIIASMLWLWLAIIVMGIIIFWLSLWLLRTFVDETYYPQPGGKDKSPNIRRVRPPPRKP